MKKVHCAFLLLLLMQLTTVTPTVNQVLAQGGEAIILVQEINEVYTSQYGDMSDVLLSPTSEEIIYFDDSGSIVVYDLNTLAIARTLDAQSAPKGMLAWSPDGMYIAAAYQDGIRVWDAANGDMIAYIESARFVCHCHEIFAPARSSIILATETYELAMYDFVTGTIDFTMSPGNSISEIDDIVFQRSGILLGVNYGPVLELWDYETGALVEQLSMSDWENALDDVFSITFSPDGGLFVVGRGPYLGEVTAWDSQTFELVWTYRAPLIPISLTWTAAGDWLVIHFSSGPLVGEGLYNGEAVTILSAASGEPLKRFAVESEVELPIELNDNEVIFNTGNNLDYITVLNLANGEVLPALEGAAAQVFVLSEGGSYGYSLNRAETRLLLGTFNGQLYLWDIQTEEIVATIQAHDSITHVLMSSTYMISVSNDEQRIRLWKLGAA